MIVGGDVDRGRALWKDEARARVTRGFDGFNLDIHRHYASRLASASIASRVGARRHRAPVTSHRRFTAFLPRENRANGRAHDAFIDGRLR